MLINGLTRVTIACYPAVVKQSDLTVGETPRSHRGLRARERTNSIIKEVVIRDVRHSVNYVDEDPFQSREFPVFLSLPIRMRLPSFIARMCYTRILIIQ